MMRSIDKGDKVSWNWGRSRVTGKVIDTYLRNQVNKLNEMDSMKRVSKAAKALLIELTDGRRVLKLETDVNREN